jgi:hypothetical protein
MNLPFDLMWLFILWAMFLVQIKIFQSVWEPIGTEADILIE